MAELALDFGPTGNGPSPIDPGSVHVLEDSSLKKERKKISFSFPNFYESLFFLSQFQNRINHLL
jgi:hypothetical protein